MRQLTAFLVVFMFAFSSSAQVALKKGDPAPSDGVFLTDKEAAKVLAEKEAQEKICEIEKRSAVRSSESLCDLKLKNMEVTLDTQEKKYEEILSLKDEELGRLYEHVEKNNVDYGALWFLGGATIATITSVAIFFVATQTVKMDSLF